MEPHGRIRVPKERPGEATGEVAVEAPAFWDVSTWDDQQGQQLWRRPDLCLRVKLDMLQTAELEEWTYGEDLRGSWVDPRHQALTVLNSDFIVTMTWFFSPGVRRCLIYF